MKKYIIQEGDNILSVAKKFGVNSKDIQEVNNLGNNYFLEPGNILYIPITIPVGLKYYKIQKGDTLTKIASSFNTNIDLLIKMNEIENKDLLNEGDILLVPKENINVYITKENDRLSDVINRLGISRDELFYFNPNLYLLNDQIITYRKK